MAQQMVLAFLMLFVGIRGIYRYRSDQKRAMQVFMGFLVLVGVALVIEGLWPH